MKKIIIVLILMLYFCANPSCALTFEYNGLWFKATSETTAKVVACKNGHYQGDIVIPDTVKYDDLTMAVTKIAEYAFSGDSLVTSIFIPKTVTNVGYFSFEDCFALQEINVHPENKDLKSIDGALYSYWLSHLFAVPGGREGEFHVPNNVLVIDIGAFLSCRKITKIFIPATVNYINIVGSTASDLDDDGGNIDGVINIKAMLSVSSYNYPALQEFVISENNPYYYFKDNCLIMKETNGIVKHIGPCPEHLIIPEGVEFIGSGAFRLNNNLKELTLPSSLITIDGHAFERCPNLTKVNIPQDSKLETIGEFAFYSSIRKDLSPFLFEIIETKIDSLYIPSSVRNIGRRAIFAKKVCLAEGIESFSWEAIKAEDYYLPSTINEFEKLSLEVNGVVRTIEITPGGKYISMDNVVFNSDTTELCLSSPMGSPQYYRIPSKVTTIAPNSFDYNNSIKELIIPGSIKELNKVFYTSFSSSLQKLIIEDGVETINNSFNFLKRLHSITYPSTLKNGYRIESSNLVEIFNYEIVKDLPGSWREAPIIHTKLGPSSIRSTSDGFLYYRDPANENRIILFDYDGVSEEAVMPELIENENYSYSPAIFYGNRNIKQLTLPNNKSIFDFYYTNYYPFEGCYNNSFIKIIIPRGATAEGRPYNIFEQISRQLEISVDPENPFLEYDNGILYNKDKTLLIGKWGNNDSIFVVPETVTEIAEYAMNSGWHNNDTIKDTKLKILNLGSVKHICAHGINVYDVCKIKIPSNIKIDWNGIDVDLTRENDPYMELELGAGDYINGSIYLRLSGYSPQSAIIKCNFNNPESVEFPFNLYDGGGLYDNLLFTASLHVPFGTKEKFETAEGWGGFQNIIETFEYVAPKQTLTYIIDDEVFRQDSIAVNSKIELPAPPQKYNYKFSGWGDVPATMGWNDIVVNAYYYKLGDVNYDNNINVADINTTVDVIMGEGTEKMCKAADVNEDELVDVVDIYSIANYVLSGSFSAKTQSKSYFDNTTKTTPELFAYSADTPGTYNINFCLDNKEHNAVALQFDIIMPEDMCNESIDNIWSILGNNYDHQIEVRQLKNNQIRCLVYSTANKVFENDIMEILRLNINESVSSIDIENVTIIMSNGELVRTSSKSFDVSSLSDPTILIDCNESQKLTINSIYNSAGQKIIKPQRGMNIINGKKIIVK